MKKKILLTIESLSGGGAELVVANLCKGLDQSVFDVTVCCTSRAGERGKLLVAEGYKVEVLPTSAGKLDKYLKCVQIAKLAQKLEIDLIHSHSPASLFDCAVAARLLRGVKHVHTFHFGNYPAINRKLLLLEKIFCRVADRLVAVGVEQRQTIATVFGLSKDRLAVVWNGVHVPELSNDLERDHSSKAGANKRIIVGSLSTLSEQKGLNYLLDAAKEITKTIPNFELWIVGDGHLKADLIAKSRSLGLDGTVRFLGWVPNAAEAVLPEIDIFVQSSLWEAMSMVVLEAMAAAKPVVVTDVGDNVHLIRHGVDGLIVPKKDPSSMAREIVRLMQDFRLGHTLAQNARARVLEKGSLSSMARSYERLYMEVIDGKGMASVYGLQSKH